MFSFFARQPEFLAWGFALSLTAAVGLAATLFLIATEPEEADEEGDDTVGT